MNLPRKVEEWHDRYRGISWNIRKWQTSTGEVKWNYYIYLNIEKIPEEYDPESFWLECSEEGGYGYYKHPIIPIIEMHYGVTYYKKHLSDSFKYGKELRSIQIGCDYSHAWDDGESYNEQGILVEVINTINNVFKLMPEYKIWCNGCGQLFNSNEMTYKSEEKNYGYCKECQERWGKK